MKASHNNAAGRVGYVRAVFSERARGFAAPVDLLRVVLRVANRMATRQRIGDAFKGYLVSESGQVLPVFSESRKKYAPRRVGCMNTGFPLPSNFGGDIDAPEWIASGAMFWVDGVGPFPVARVRGES